MRTLLTLLSVLIISSSIAFSADYTPFTPPEVSKEMFEGTTFEADPSAKAVYLYHCATAMLETKYSKPHRVTKYKARIRIYDEEAIETYKQFVLSYNSSNGAEELRDIVVKCYNLSPKGKIEVAETKKKEFIEKIEKDEKDKKRETTTYTIPLKDIKVGSIIDYEYTLFSPYFFYPNPWQYQKYVPVLYSEYIYELVNMGDFARIEKGEQFLDLDEEYDGKGVHAENGALLSTKVYVTSMTDIPAFTAKDHLDDISSYISNIRFFLKGVTQNGYESTLVPWNEQVTKYIESDEYKNFLSDAGITVGNIASELRLEDYFEPSELLRVVYNYVKDNYECTEGFGPVPDKKFKDFLKDKSGDPATINLFMMAIIKEAGYEVTPLCVSTRYMGKLDKSMPTEMSLPFMILYVNADGEEFYMNAMNDYVQWNMLIPSFVDREGLLMKEGGVEWKTTTGYKGTTSTLKCVAEINPAKENNTVKCSNTSTGYQAFGNNSAYKSLKKDDSLSAIKRSFEKEMDIKIIDDLVFEQMESRTSNPVITFSAEYPIEKNGDKFIVKPFLNIAKKNFKTFEAPKRIMPIEFAYEEKNTIEVDLKIDPAYKITEMPSDATWKINDGTIIFDYKVKKVNENNVIITATVDYKQRVYPSSAYAEIKKLHDDIINQCTKALVLEKK